jgi:hypothetical protein
MSFRKEIKLLLDPRKSFDFKEMILQKGAITLYPKRDISSLYFDNSFKKCHKDSIEGSLPRKKIRIRTYPGEKNKIYLLEKKISSPEGRYKSSLKISTKYCNKITKYGYFDRAYGILFPVIYVNYSREYYKFKNFRITIDKKINYSLYKRKTTKQDTKSVIEIKFNQKDNENLIINSFTNKITRFSKYSNGIQLFNL